MRRFAGDQRYALAAGTALGSRPATAIFSARLPAGGLGPTDTARRQDGWRRRSRGRVRRSGADLTDRPRGRADGSAPAGRCGSAVTPYELAVGPLGFAGTTMNWNRYRVERMTTNVDRLISDQPNESC